MRTMIRLLLSAIAFVSILPMIHGIDFHGNFWIALLISVVFGVMLWAVEAITVAIAAVWTISSFGLALLWLIPIWIIGFWLLPVFAFILTADVMPQYLSVSGFIPAAEAGLIMLFIALLTSKTFWPDKKRSA